MSRTSIHADEALVDEIEEAKEEHFEGDVSHQEVIREGIDSISDFNFESEVEEEFNRAIGSPIRNCYAELDCSDMRSNSFAVPGSGDSTMELRKFGTDFNPMKSNAMEEIYGSVNDVVRQAYSTMAESSELGGVTVTDSSVSDTVHDIVEDNGVDDADTVIVSRNVAEMLAEYHSLERFHRCRLEYCTNDVTVEEERLGLIDQGRDDSGEVLVVNSDTMGYEGIDTQFDTTTYEDGRETIFRFYTRRGFSVVNDESVERYEIIPK